MEVDSELDEHQRLTDSLIGTCRVAERLHELFEEFIFLYSPR